MHVPETSINKNKIVSVSEFILLKTNEKRENVETKTLTHAASRYMFAFYNFMSKLKWMIIVIVWIIIMM